MSEDKTLREEAEAEVLRQAEAEGEWTRRVEDVVDVEVAELAELRLAQQKRRFSQRLQSTSFERHEFRSTQITAVVVEDMVFLEKQARSGRSGAHDIYVVGVSERDQPQSEWNPSRSGSGGRKLLAFSFLVRDRSELVPVMRRHPSVSFEVESVLALFANGEKAYTVEWRK